MSIVSAVIVANLNQNYFTNVVQSANELIFFLFRSLQFSKGALLICGVLFGLGAIFFYLCYMVSRIELLLIGRFIVGLSSGVTTAVLGMYLAEIAPSELRGALATFSGLGLLIDIFMNEINISFIYSKVVDEFE